MRNLFLSDEELGKKDDDHPVKSPRRPSSWQPTRAPPRRSLRRIALAFALAVLVYLFVHNIPVLGPNDRMRRPSYNPSRRQPPSRPNSQSPGDARHPPDPATQFQTQDVAVDAAKRDYGGPIRYQNLAVSLQAISNTRGSEAFNRNILFAAASLKSAATLLPMACQMALELKSNVHFALLGRSSIDIDHLWDINGIHKTCAVISHDARPDYVGISTIARLEKSVFRGFHHIHNYMHPQAIIVDGSSDEDVYFLQGLKQHERKFGTTLIELPRWGSKSLGWITKLDSASLRMWNKVKFDILIQATPKSAGSLIRLLRSLSAADYTASAIPHITIELPRQIDTATNSFLNSFAWPPSHVPNPTKQRFLSLKHRISRRQLTEEESTTRFLESFWPAQPRESHVLVLSPHAEVAPQYFNYLKYLLLAYRYSGTAEFQGWGQQLFGISLEQPLMTLDGVAPFAPPRFQHPEDVNKQSGGESNPFIWQAPSSNAVLFLGDKWIELHDFVSRTLEAGELLEAMPALVSEKAIHKQHPAWLEHALRLARVRGYGFLYPGTEVGARIATVHGELYSVPEEYAGDKANGKIRQKVRAADDTKPTGLALLDTLPNNGVLWPISALPVADWEGREVDEQYLRHANEFEALFKSSVGGCEGEGEGGSVKGQKPYEGGKAQDLFCNLP
ncbi:hypothetical protein F4808DRAFT_462031 [Astrocystis sublimbata]|nr:hypothetical protein F4808DRAFT_462031 [Astrocystis sublimbata]